MPVLIALLAIWTIPVAAYAALLLGGWLRISPLVEWGYLGFVLGIPLSVVLSLLVVPAMLLGQAADARDRRRAAERRAARR